MVPMREEDVTRRVAGWLESGGWRILSVHAPGTQGGLRLRPIGVESKSEGTLIPDIVAARDGCVAVLESKPEYCDADVQKVRTVAEDPRYRDDLERVALMTEQSLASVLVGVCFSGPLPATHPDGVALVHVDGDGVEAIGVAAATRRPVG